MITDINPLELPSLPLNCRNKLPSLAAIYIVLSENDDILYVGKAINLANRWMQHHRFKQFGSYQSVRIAWLECSDETLLDQVERMLIKSLTPLLNNTRVPERTVEVKEGTFCKAIKVRLNTEDYEFLERESQRRDIPVSQIVREGLKILKNQLEPVSN